MEDVLFLCIERTAWFRVSGVPVWLSLPPASLARHQPVTCWSWRWALMLPVCRWKQTVAPGTVAATEPLLCSLRGVRALTVVDSVVDVIIKRMTDGVCGRPFWASANNLEWEVEMSRIVLGSYCCWQKRRSFQLKETGLYHLVLTVLWTVCSAAQM